MNSHAPLFMSSLVTDVLWALALLIALLALYIYTNDQKITRLPDNWQSLTTKTRVTPDDVHATAARLAQGQPLSINSQLPPKTGRRYIVVGGVCFSFLELQTFSFTICIGWLPRWLDRNSIT